MMYKTNYTPDLQQQKQIDVLEQVCVNAASQKVFISVFGGYGLDGLVGKLTRDHHDIDILVRNTDREKLKDILKVMGFSLFRANESKELYKNPILGEDFQIEVSKENRLNEFQEVGKREIFTDLPNAKLNNFNFYTPTVKGHQFIHKMQAKRALERGWQSEYRHEETRAELINYLKEDQPY